MLPFPKVPVRWMLLTFRHFKLQEAPPVGLRLKQPLYAHRMQRSRIVSCKMQRMSLFTLFAAWDSSATCLAKMFLLCWCLAFFLDKNDTNPAHEWRIVCIHGVGSQENCQQMNQTQTVSM